MDILSLIKRSRASSLRRGPNRQEQLLHPEAHPAKLYDVTLYKLDTITGVFQILQSVLNIEGGSQLFRLLVLKADYLPDLIKVTEIIVDLSIFIVEGPVVIDPVSAVFIND